MNQYEELLNKQRAYFESGVTLNVEFRIKMLQRLKTCILKYESEIKEAMRQDLGKSEFESYMCEVGMVLSEIDYMLKHVRKYAKRKTVRTPLAQFPAKSFIQPTPYGNVLIMSPWNYPFLLTMDPLVDAIAAGNCAVVKPSAYSMATSTIVQKVLEECFDEAFVAVVTGGRKENAALLDQKFDMIFFTGSQFVGKEVMRKAAEHLTPVVLELGGKSPCIVDDSAKIDLAAKRIVFGKFMNCGQTCVAPDYILCDCKIKDELIEAICKEVQCQFGERPLDNQNYGKIVNLKHFERLLGLIDEKKVICGGSYDREALRIEPTVLDEVTFNDPVMQEEIFGPILPVLTYDSFEEIDSILNCGEKPLAFYVFSENKSHIDQFLEKCRFGGGCVNDTLIHLATSEMGFGGVGESGMGSYHGKTGFDAFTHYKSIVDKKTWLDLSMRYQPYTKENEKLIRMFLK